MASHNGTSTLTPIVSVFGLVFPQSLTPGSDDSLMLLSRPTAYSRYRPVQKPIINIPRGCSLSSWAGQDRTGTDYRPYSPFASLRLPIGPSATLSPIALLHFDAVALLSLKIQIQSLLIGRKNKSI